MPSLKLEWTGTAKAQFDQLRRRALNSGRFDEFRLAHNEIVATLRDLAKAEEKGERLYDTRRPGGEVRHWVHRFISVCYAVCRDERVGWILRYKFMPESWPDNH